MIKLVDVNKTFRTQEIETHALCNVNMEIQDSEFASIMRASGCGKGTLLNILGLDDET